MMMIEKTSRTNPRKKALAPALRRRGFVMELTQREPKGESLLLRFLAANVAL
jgi:hypothetical protein